MPAPLATLADPETALAPRANLVELLQFLARSPRASLTHGDGWARWWMPIPHPWFNGIHLSRPPDPTVDDSLIADTIAYFRGQGVSTFTGWLDATPPPPAWHERLRAHGFSYDADTPGMVADIAALAHPPIPPPDFRIVPVSDSPTLRLWAEVFIAGYELPAPWADDFFRLLDGLALGPPLLTYLGYQGDTPVTASSLFLGERVAGIYNVATLPQARRQGLGAAMTLAPLRDAHAAGYRVAVLQSSQMGYRVYEELGFRRTCAVDGFYWSE